VHYVFDTFGQANVTVRGEIRPRQLFFLTADYRIRAGSGEGHHQRGGEDRRQGAGQRRHPLNTSDFSSFLLQAAGLEGQGDRAC